MRSLIYKWHRRLSIIIAIPVLLWAASGFMHPLMTNIKPAVARQSLTSVPVDSQRIHISLQTALRLHHIDSIANARLIHIDTNWFYQVQSAWPAAATENTPSGALIYLSCTNGNVLAAGDWLYAQYLARQFLEGPDSNPTNHSSHTSMAATPAMDHSTHTSPIPEPAMDHSAHDCCGAATECVLNPAKGTKVSNVSTIAAFDPEYKSINRLLPVYRVSFDRADGIRIYVETGQDRFAFAMDNRRAIFDNIFRLFHTYGWLEWLGKGRLAVELTLALLACCTSLMGIYIFCISRTKSPKGNPMLRARRNHRYVSIVAALFTLMWTFSGAWHAFSKFTDDTRDKYFVRDNFATNAAAITNPDLPRIQTLLASPLTNLSIANIDGLPYWRISTPSKINYINAANYSLLPDGDAHYARSLASRFSGRPAASIVSTSRVTAFGDEYNFTDKRLPVWRITYNLPSRERFYIETSTGRLASRVDDRSLREGWSFSIFHKHHFMDWGGKSTRDASTMFWAFAQLLMVVVGLILCAKSRRRSK